jgi:hypothetical protein
MASVLIVPAYASNITITIQKEAIVVKMVLSLHQNMTNFPNQTSTLNMAQDPSLSSAFAEGVKKVEPKATISDLTLAFNVTGHSLNVTTQMRLTGVSDRRGDIAAVTTTWKAFNVSADLRSGNFSYNRVGSRYLRPIVDYYVNASRFENNPNSTIKGVSFLLNQTQVVPSSVEANTVGNFTVFDFRPLNVSIDKWTRTYSLRNDTTTWRYTPIPLLGAAVKVQEINASRYMFASLGYDAEISVTGLARASGDSVLVDVGTGWEEWVMMGIVVFAIVAAVVIQILYRGRKKAIRLGRR